MAVKKPKKEAGQASEAPAGQASAPKKRRKAAVEPAPQAASKHEPMFEPEPQPKSVTSGPSLKPKALVALSKLRQEEIQAACLLAIELSEKARQPGVDAIWLLEQLNRLIHSQQGLENDLAQLQTLGQDLTHLWWQAAELETLIFGLYQAIGTINP